jgi:hypothetical protein
VGLLLLVEQPQPQPQEEVRKHCYSQISCLWGEPELLLVQPVREGRQRKFQQKEERPLELLEPELPMLVSNHHQTRNLPSTELLEQRVHYHHQSQSLLVLGQALPEVERELRVWLQRKAALRKVLPSSRLARVLGLQRRIHLHLHLQQQQQGLVLEYFQRRTPW